MDDFDPLVSFYPNAFENLPTDISAAQFLADIKSGKFASQIKLIRQRFKKAIARGVPYKDAKKAVDSQKKKLGAVTLAGTQAMRGNKFPPQFTGLIQADFDLLGDKLQYYRELLADDPHVFALFLSATGEGLKAFYRIPVCKNADEYKIAFDALAAHVFQLTGWKIDELKEVARLCYASHDKDCLHNPNAVALPVDFSQMPPPVAQTIKTAKSVPSKSQFFNGESRRFIAERIVGAVEWESDVLGYTKCPGEHLHTNGNALKDCRVTLDGVPTVFCLHKSCVGVVETANKNLRSQIGKAEFVPTWMPQAAPVAKRSDIAEVTAWIRGETLRTLADKESLPSVKNSIVAKQVVDALAKIGRFYFHADLRDFASALFFNAHSKRLERIRSDGFIAWLSNWLVINRASGLFKYIVSEVETAALSSAHTTGIVPEAYFAARPDMLYLSSGDGQAVKITANGTQLVDNGTDGVLFSAGRTMQPWKLVEPRDVFETCAIFRNAHSSATHGRTLLQLWIYSFATMPRSKPPLGVIGEIGSGKTRTLKGVAEFYGIPFRAAKVEEQLEPNFWPNVNEGGLFILDNADTKVRWLADAVAAAATDGCSQRRKLYTNSETVTLRANAWLALTSANPTFGNDAGLADRLLLVRMERRGEETSDAALTDEILANRDAGLSHLAETLRAALADTAPPPAGLNARHPDFAAFAVRIGRALGREAEAVAALKHAETDKSAFCLENDNIGAALLACLADGEIFTGTASELCEKIIATDADLRDKLNAKRLGKRLAALWPHLEKQLGTARRETGRSRIITYEFKIRPSGECDEFQVPFP